MLRSLPDYICKDRLFFKSYDDAFLTTLIQRHHCVCVSIELYGTVSRDSLRTLSNRGDNVRLSLKTKYCGHWSWWYDCKDIL